MPRIELLPPGWDESPAKKRGDGSPTIDVCYSCAESFEDGEVIAADVIDDLNDNGAGDFEHGTECGSTEVEHPPYDDDDYHCAVCGDELTPQDE